MAGFNPWEFFGEWAPGPQRRHPRSYAQFLASVLGLGRDAIASTLASVEHITPQLAGRMASHAVAFAERLQQWQAGELGDTIPRAHIPRNPAIPKAYRAVARIRLNCYEESDRTDAEGKMWFTVVLDYAHNPSAREVTEHAQNMMQGIVAKSRKYDAHSLCDPEFVEIVALERRT